MMLLCHKEPARRIQSPILGALECKIHPYAIKNQQGSRMILISDLLPYSADKGGLKDWDRPCCWCKVHWFLNETNSLRWVGVMPACIAGRECNLRPLIKLMMKFHTFLNMTGSLKRRSKNSTTTERYKDFADGAQGGQSLEERGDTWRIILTGLGLAGLCLN